MTDIAVVLFDRDLRIHDHGPLNAACKSGMPVLPLYVFDPANWGNGNKGPAAFEFVRQSLRELDQALRERGGHLVVRTGKASEILASLHLSDGIGSVHTHSGNGDWAEQMSGSDVARWARRAGIPYREATQHGLTGPALSAQDLDQRWNSYMTRVRFKAPAKVPAADIAPGEIPDAHQLGLSGAQPSTDEGGRAEGIAWLEAFINGDGGVRAGLEAHLDYGTLSLREAYQAGIRAIRTARAANDNARRKQAETLMRVLNHTCLGQQKKVVARPGNTFRAAAPPLRDRYNPLSGRKAAPNAVSNAPVAASQQLSFDWSLSEAGERRYAEKRKWTPKPAER